MKALRGLKKRKHIPVEDPQKIALEKLAILSDQAFIYTAEDNSGSQSWTINSFNMAPRSNLQLHFHEHVDAKTLKIKEKTPSNYHNKNRPSLSEQLMNENQLKRYFKVSEDERLKKNVSQFFPERKSLSLTNYILFDKRKPSDSSKEKSPSSKYDFQRLKLLQLKKMIISRRNKRNLSTQQRLNYSQTHNPTPTSKTKIYFSQNNTQHNKQVIDEKQLIIPKKKEQRSFSYAETILESLIKRKDVPNINVKKYNKQYELSVERVEKARQIESSMNSTKIKLHDYYKKFVY